MSSFPGGSPALLPEPERLPRPVPSGGSLPWRATPPLEAACGPVTTPGPEAGRRGRPITIRHTLAVVAGALVAAAAALLLGEYPFEGLLVLGSGVLVGLLVAETVISLGAWRGPVPGAACAVLAAIGLVWAGWIAEGHELGRIAPEGWVAVVLGATAGGLRAWWPGTRADSSTSSASPP